MPLKRITLVLLCVCLAACTQDVPAPEEPDTIQTYFLDFSPYTVAFAGEMFATQMSGSIVLALNCWNGDTPVCLLYRVAEDGNTSCIGEIEHVHTNALRCLAPGKLILCANTDLPPNPAQAATPGIFSGTSYVYCLNEQSDLLWCKQLPTDDANIFVTKHNVIAQCFYSERERLGELILWDAMGNETMSQAFSDELLTYIVESQDEERIQGVFIHTENHSKSFKTIDQNLVVLQNVELPKNQDEIQAVFSTEEGVHIVSNKYLYTVSSNKVTSKDAEAWYRSGGLDTKGSYYAAIDCLNAENGFFREVIQNDDYHYEASFFATYQENRLDIQRIKPYENIIYADISKSGDKLLVCGKSGEITIYQWL